MSWLLWVVFWMGGSDAPVPLFVERASELGIDFEYWNGRTGRRYMPEIVGGGAALLDYDRDGDLDLFLVQGTTLDPGNGGARETTREREGRAPRHRLYRNLWQEEGRLRFVDVSTEAGLGRIEPSYGIGVTTGDYDNDGDVDLYVTNLGANQLFRNEGDGTFRELGQEAGVADAGWGVPALLFDYDRDGALDLYIGNYVEYSVSIDKECRSLAGIRDYCGPLSYAAAEDRLFRNQGDGHFRDVTVAAGIDRPGSTLGAEAADLNGDGLVDLYVANDGMPNFLWLNQGDGTFLDDGLMAGLAVNHDGQPEASMGTALGDYDSDGDDDLFLTHLAGETNTLYQNLGDGLFEDVTRGSGLGTASLAETGFGTAWLDFDLDGRLDLLVVNGAVRFPEDAEEGEMFPLEQPDRLFRNLGGGRFLDVTASLAPVLLEEHVSRGVAVGDLDNDGDSDFVVVDSSGPLRVFVNDSRRSGPSPEWLGVVLEAEPPSATTLASVELILGEVTLLRRSKVTGSYASASDPRVVFGLAGASTRSTGEQSNGLEVRVHWGSGESESFLVRAGGYNTLVRGRGDTDEGTHP